MPKIGNQAIHEEDNLWYFWDERETALNLNRTELVELRKQLKEIELQKPKYQARSASAREADLRLANNETQLDKLLDQIARKHSINIEDFKGRTVKAGDRDEDKEGGIIVEKQTVTIRKTSLEKLAKDHKSPFTWVKGKSLEDLEKPESIKKIKEHHKKQLEKLKNKKSKEHENNPFLKGEDITVEENISMDDVSSSCLICHK